MTEPAVTFRAVTKRYGRVTAVDDVSFDIAPASLVTLLGPSGCGKTTTLRLIAGLEHASAGRIGIGGADVTTLSAADRDVSMVFQSYALFPHMTVMENACYGLRASGLTRAQAEARAADKLRLVGLTGFERRLPSELSGGQQQRVAVARAIVLEPQVLLFDEPLSNLDAKLRRRVRDEIRALQQDLHLTVVYVTHDQEEALAVSDRIIVMSQARIAQDGTPRELYEAPASRFVADFIGNANLLPVTLRHDDATMGTATLGALAVALPHRNLPAGPALLAVRPHAVRLSATGDGLAGKVAHAAYLGGHMEYGVELPGIEDELFAIATDIAQPLRAGQDVRVRFDPGGVAVVRAEEE
ncbi:MAG: ABC transporter ATP-binding protein [Acetobacteraceae bacterium]|nr:ABC transporter ATP-binding protein [Acetobacteraceae bacterium]